MIRLNASERSLLLGAYGGGCRTLDVRRRPLGRPPVLVAGSRAFSGDTRLRALASLYSRGLVAQVRLNRFSLTPSGRALLRFLRRVREELGGASRVNPDRTRTRGGTRSGRSGNGMPGQDATAA